MIDGFTGLGPTSCAGMGEPDSTLPYNSFKICDLGDVIKLRFLIRKMPTIPLRLPSTDESQAPNGVANPLPKLLHTPSGLALLEIQGTINMPNVELSSDEQDNQSGRTSVGRLVFPDYTTDAPSGSKTWMKRVYLYVGRHQRLTGEVKKLANPVALIRKRLSDEVASRDNEELEITDIVYYKVVFSSRPEPVSND